MASFVPALARASLRGTGRDLARLARVSPRAPSSTDANASAAAASAGPAPPDPPGAASSSPLPPGSFGAAIARPWAEALVELSQPSATDATLDLATGEGTCAFAVADAIEEAKIWGPPAGAGALGGAPEGLMASVLGLDKDRHALARAKQAALSRRDARDTTRATQNAPNEPARHARERVERVERVVATPLTFAWADACRADAPWHEGKERSFARAYCAFGLNRFADPERACVRVRETLVPGGPFVCSVWAPLREQTQPLFYAAYVATAETLEEMARHRARDERWLVDAETALKRHFTAPFDWVEPGEDENARAIDKLERVLIRAGFDAPDAATERAGHARFRNLEHAADSCVASCAFFHELRDAEGGRFHRAFLARFEAHLLRAAGDGLTFERNAGASVVGTKGEGSSVAVPLTAYFAHATAPWR